jgi:cytochrome c556
VTSEDPTRAAVVALLLLASAACGPTPEPEAGPGEVAEAEVPSPANPTLKEIMQALETDMAGVAHGIWIEDMEAVRAAAARVADHPRVTPEQMATIQATLGADFATFAGMDQAVHGASVALRDAAGQAPISELTSGYQRIQQGCVACHAAFRPRVSEALNPSGG